MEGSQRKIWDGASGLPLAGLFAWSVTEASHFDFPLTYPFDRQPSTSIFRYSTNLSNGEIVITSTNRKHG